MDVPNKRNKWQAIRGIIDALSWERINALGRSGNLLGTVELDPELLEDQADDDPAAKSANHAELALMLKAQETVLKFFGQHQDRLMKSAVDMVEAATERAASLERTVDRLSKQQEKLQGQLLRTQTEEGSEEMQDMIKALVMQAMIKQQGGGH